MTEKLSILVPAAAVVVLLSAMVIAAPQVGAEKGTIAAAPDHGLPAPAGAASVVTCDRTGCLSRVHR